MSWYHCGPAHSVEHCTVPVAIVAVCLGLSVSSPVGQVSWATTVGLEPGAAA